MSRYLGLCLLVLAGCPLKNNARYCDSSTACPDPKFPFCDLARRECVSTVIDFDLSGSVDDLAGADLSRGDMAEADQSMPPDMAVPMCSSHGECGAATPICDPTSMMCRVCSGAGDDALCAARGAATPRCKLGGTNMGSCVQCNVNTDCQADPKVPGPNPFCTPEGTCRPCAAHAECDSKLCVLTTGLCRDEDDIVYVDNMDSAACSNTGKDGTRGSPYCTLGIAIANIGSRTHIHLAGSNANYQDVNVFSTTPPITVIGPGLNAPKRATIQGSSGENAFGLYLDGTETASFTFEGVRFLADDFSTVYCEGTSTTNANLTIRDSIIESGTRLYASYCNLTLNGCYIRDHSTWGVELVVGSRFDIQNSFIYDSAKGVRVKNDSLGGTFAFNTVAYNTSAPGGIDCDLTPTVIVASIVVGNATMSGTQFDHDTRCTLISVVTGPDGINQGEIEDLPVFVTPSPAPRDLHLKTDTTPSADANRLCCIDKVTPGPMPTPSPFPTRDIDNEMRFKGVSYDIGADEAL